MLLRNTAKVNRHSFLRPQGHRTHVRQHNGASSKAIVKGNTLFCHQNSPAKLFWNRHFNLRCFQVTGASQTSLCQTRSYSIEVPNERREVDIDVHILDKGKPSELTEKQKTAEQLEKQRIEQARQNMVYVKPFLNHIVKLDMLRQETPERIRQIWTDYHKTKYGICAVTDPTQYSRLKGKLIQYPNFLVALPRKNRNTEFFFQQARGNAILYTPAEVYRVHGADAKPALTIMHYIELVEEKNLVLMRGEIDPEILTPAEAQTLVNFTQAFYLDEERFETVQLFNKDPAKFDVQKLLIDLPITAEIELPSDKENKKQKDE